MPVTVCLAASALGYAQGGGHLWAYLNWALGLREVGCEVLWLEQAPETGAAELARHFDALRRDLAPFGLADRIALHAPAERLPAGAIDAGDLEDVDLLLNLAYEVPDELLAGSRRSAFVDIDPGMTQLWLAGGLLERRRHDVYFTVGEGVADGTAGVDLLGIEWRHTPPCVSLQQWPASKAVDGPYTTVTHWWGDEEWVGGAAIDNSKRAAWAPLLDLPRSSPVPLELALGGLEDEPERRLLQSKGWAVHDAWQVADDPRAFRAYVASSRGELSAAKPAYVRLRTGWFSDRSACYLASGRPAIVQWTGDSRFLDGGEGVLRFQTPEQAAEALRTVEADYARHAACARELAERYLDARKVVSRVLEQALDG